MMIGPPTNRIRRPHRSATNPEGTFVNMRASANALRVSPTAAVETPNVRTKSGRIGPAMPYPSMTSVVLVQTINRISF